MHPAFTPGMEREVVQDLKQAGLLQFASEVGYLDSLPRAQPAPSPGAGPARPAPASVPASQFSEEASRIISEAGASARAAEAELARSVKRVHSLLNQKQQQGSRAEQGDGPASNSTESSMSRQGRKCARTTPDPGSARGANKGLRHFAMQVCNKIEAKGRTTYNEVADELVIELKDQADGGDDKNIRRRVYDAFNVLLAVGIIGKEGKKDILWKGFPKNQSAAVDRAHAERERRVQAVEKKQKELQMLIEQNNMVTQLLEANPVRGPNDTDMALQIPFVLVRAKPEATVEVSVSENMQEVDFKFNSQFTLHDDSFVLQQIIQHYGSIKAGVQPPGECAASS